MTLLAHVAMFGWIPFVLLLFAVLPPRRAILVAYIGGFLFLPNAAYDISGLPDYTKSAASSLAVLLGVGIFHPAGLRSFRIRWLDLPMVVFCLSPIVTSVLNDLGVYDGLSRLIGRLIDWGVPYLIGRTFFSSYRGMYELAAGIFIGGLVYVPFCLWEIRMSPNLQFDIYGFRTRNFAMGVRYGGYRPIVFLWSHIAVSTSLAIATASGFWLWWSGRLRQIAGFSTLIPVLVLFVTLLLAKTLAGLLLLAIAGGVLLSRGVVRRPSLLAIVTLLVPLLVGLRATGVWDGEEMVSIAATINEERSDSLRHRVDNENLLAEKARQRPFFGWGAWGRSRVYNDSGKDISTTDGLWVIVLGKSGLVGLGALLLMFVVLLLRFDLRFPGRSWLNPQVAPAAAIAAVILMAFVNNVPNVTSNPIVPIAMGGIGVVGAAPLRGRGAVQSNAPTRTARSRRTTTRARVPISSVRRNPLR